MMTNFKYTLVKFRLFTRLRVFHARKGEEGFVIYLVVVVIFVIGLYVELLIASQYISAIGIQRKLCDLQARVCAYSGLNLSMAYLDGLEGHDFTWQTDKVTRDLGKFGSVVVNAKDEGGWLRVTSTGFFGKDTCTLVGTLGQTPPSFTSNALNISQSTGNIVIADRANLLGNLGIKSGGVILKNNGVFTGVVKPLQIAVYNDTVIEEEVSQAANFFNQGNPAGFVSTSSDLKSSLQSMRAIGNTELYIPSDITIQSDSIDCKDATIRVRGNLTLAQSVRLKNAHVYVLGEIDIKDLAAVQKSTLISLGKVRINGQASVQGTVAGCDSMIVEENARFFYPSFIYLSSNNAINRFSNGVIIIQDEAVIRGTIATARFGLDSYQPRVMLLSKAKVHGFIACPATATLYGNVAGSVYVGENVYRYQKNIYENWLKEAGIKSIDLSASTIPLLFPSEGHPQYLHIAFAGKSYD